MLDVLPLPQHARRDGAERRRPLARARRSPTTAASTASKASGTTPEPGARQLLADDSLGVLVFEEAVTAAQVEDGLSHTVAVAEALMRRRSTSEWTRGHNVFAHEGARRSTCGRAWATTSAARTRAARRSSFCDGHVEFLHNDMDVTAFTQLLHATPARGSDAMTPQHASRTRCVSCCMPLGGVAAAGDDRLVRRHRVLDRRRRHSAAVAIDFDGDSATDAALVWGFRWDGAATGRDMLNAVVTADARLFAKIGTGLSYENALLGVGYDRDADGVFGVSVGATFDGDGFAYGPPRNNVTPTDPGDWYREGFDIGFWHYGISRRQSLDDRRRGRLPSGGAPPSAGRRLLGQLGVHDRRRRPATLWTSSPRTR